MLHADEVAAARKAMQRARTVSASAARRAAKLAQEAEAAWRDLPPHRERSTGGGAGEVNRLRSSLT